GEMATLPLRVIQRRNDLLCTHSRQAPGRHAEIPIRGRSGSEFWSFSRVGTALAAKVTRGGGLEGPGPCDANRFFFVCRTSQAKAHTVKDRCLDQIFCGQRGITTIAPTFRLPLSSR